MNLLLFLALLVTIAYVGGMYLFGRKGRISFYTGGVEFLLIGAVLGSGIVTPFTNKVVFDLYPFVHIELAWIGLLYGIQFEWRRLRRYPLLDWGLMSAESILSMAFIFFASYYLINAFTSALTEDIIFVSLLLAAAGSLSSPWTLGIISNVFKVRTATINRLRFIVSIDDLPGLAVFFTLFFYPLAEPGRIRY